MFKVGDIIIVTDDYYQRDNNGNKIAGMKGRIITNKGIDCLIDFGVGFSGHRGLYNELKTSTGWYVHREYLKTYKKGNHSNYV